MEYEFLVDGQLEKVSVERREDKTVFMRHGRRMDADVMEVGPDAVSLLVDGRSYLVHITRHKDRIFVSVGARQFLLLEARQESSTARFRDSSMEKAEGTIKAPMPGMVIKVNVEAGSEVAPGDALVIVEAMKMEHEMRAAFAAIVDKVYVNAGQQVDAFQPLVELRAKEAAL
jgi:acetyl-CoA/propionyl-CoA carboxylase, biotin carboxylase, biotin carboxyl carrier protein